MDDLVDIRQGLNSPDFEQLGPPGRAHHIADLGFRVLGFGGLGFRGLGFRGLGFGVWGIGV